MRKNIRFIVLLLIPTLVLTTSFHARAEAGDKVVLNLSIEESVKLGLENSIDLRLVQNEIDLSDVKNDRARYLSNKLEDGKEELSEGKKKANQALNYLDKGISPINITLPNGMKIDEKTNINNLPISEEDKKTIIKEIRTSIKGKVDSGEQNLTNALQEAGNTLSNKLNFDSLDALGVDATSDLSRTMASVAYEVTKASYDIYRNKIAMLIQKNYYDVLKAQKLLEVKKKAMDRGKKQYEFSKAGYEEGMKAKDEMLMAQAYYEGTQIQYRKAQGDFKNSLIEFKKSINVPLETKVVLTDVLVNDREIPDLEEGLLSGLKNRLEVKKAIGEVGVYDLNLEVTKKKYPSNTFQYKEANLLKEKARINYEKTYLEVENSIRQSYETLMSTGEMLEVAKDMVEGVKETVDIAEYKYKEGFGVETSLLKKLDIESAAGTIVEVLAAEENLAEVEEKVIEIMYGYNLAKMKYYNDIGELIY